MSNINPLDPKNFKGPQTNRVRGVIPDDTQKHIAQPETSETAVTDADVEAANTVLTEEQENDALLKNNKELRRIMDKSKGERTPEEKNFLYVEGLKDVGLTLEEARGILDDLITKGYHTREYRIGNKLRVVFRTRDCTDLERTLRLLEAEAPRIPMHVDDLISRFNMAASLGAYDRTEFKFVDLHSAESSEKVAEQATEYFNSRYAFVRRLPIPIIARMHAFLVDFDTRVAAALAEGAPEDF
jgi:hypothetical protein